IQVSGLAGRARAPRLVRGGSPKSRRREPPAGPDSDGGGGGAPPTRTSRIDSDHRADGPCHRTPVEAAFPPWVLIVGPRRASLRTTSRHLPSREAQLMYSEISTPAPVVDLDRLDRNLDRMASYASAHGLALRPHIKTHKAPAVGRRQVERGAIGLTCATPRELEVMSEVTNDLLLAYPPVGAAKLERVMALPS